MKNVFRPHRMNPKLRFALVLIAGTAAILIQAKPGEAVCCVSCHGMRVCGCAIDMDCGSCCTPPCCFPEEVASSSGSDADKRSPVDVFNLVLSIDKNKPSSYRVKRTESIVIGTSDASYLVMPTLSDDNPKTIEVDVKKVYSFWGIQFQLEYGSTRVKQGKDVTAMPAKIGLLSIWSAEFVRGTEG